MHIIPYTPQNNVTYFGLLLGQGDVGPVLGIKVNANEATDCIHQAGIEFSTL